jgi:ABC-type uncharacterized transport system permease subunit
MVVATKLNIKLIPWLLKKITATLNLNLMMFLLMTSIFIFLNSLYRIWGERKKNENGLKSGFHHKTFCIL